MFSIKYTNSSSCALEAIQGTKDNFIRAALLVLAAVVLPIQTVEQLLMV